jgi:hypothetical protein
MAFAPSLQKPYDDHSPYDPAFVQLADDATDADRAARADVIRRCRERGDWAELLIDGGIPTVFRFRPLPGHVFRALMDLASGGKLGGAQLGQVFFRAALIGVQHLDGAEVRCTATIDGVPGKIAGNDVPDRLDSYDQRIVAELGDEVFRRASAISPRP